MKCIKLIVFLILSVVNYCRASEWRDESLKKIEELSAGDRNAFLGHLIWQLGVLSSGRSLDKYPLNSDQKDVVDFASAKVIEIDGFGEMIADMIRISKNEFKLRRDESKYNRSRSHAIGSLGLIKSVDSVRELGNLLDDMEWTRDPLEHIMSGADWTQLPPNGILAARSLATLVESPPIQKDPENYLESDIEPWRLWYAQVKAGTRTFRFKGDPQEYTLTGPAEKAVEPPAASGPRPESFPNDSDGSSEAASEEAPAVPWVALMASLGLCAVAVWLALAGRRPRK